jgi:hypothetical protein
MAEPEIATPAPPAPPPPFESKPIILDGDNDDVAVERFESILNPKPVEAPVKATPATKSAPVEGKDAAPPEEAASGDDAEAAEPDDSPAIEPPASWTKEAKEKWSKLDPETQSYIAERERERDTTVSKAQRTAAETAKTIEAERKAIEAERQQLQTRLPQILNALNSQLLGDDLAKMTATDWTKLATESPADYVRLKATYDQRMATLSEAHKLVHETQAKAQAENDKRMQTWKAEQVKLAREHAPEFFDEKNGVQYSQKVTDYLKDYGFSEDEIGVIADHRFYRVLRDAVKGKEAANVKAVVEKKVKNLPPVAKPGSSQDQGDITYQKRTALKQKLGSQTASDDELAAALAQLM